MTFIKITYNTSSVTMDYGDYAGKNDGTGILPEKKTFPKSELIINLLKDAEYIELYTIYDSLTFPVAVDKISEVFTVDSVNNENPKDNKDLYDKLIAMFQ